MKVDTREAFNYYNFARKRFSEIEEQARRINMRIDYEAMELVEINPTEKKETVIKQIKKQANGENYH
jgi:hypothetical protein